MENNKLKREVAQMGMLSGEDHIKLMNAYAVKGEAVTVKELQDSKLQRVNNLIAEILNSANEPVKEEKKIEEKKELVEGVSKEEKEKQNQRTEEEETKK